MVKLKKKNFGNIASKKYLPRKVLTAVNVTLITLTKMQKW